MSRERLARRQAIFKLQCFAIATFSSYRRDSLRCCHLLHRQVVAVPQCLFVFFVSAQSCLFFSWESP